MTTNLLAECHMKTDAGEERLLAAYRKCDEMERKLVDSEEEFERLIAEKDESFKVASEEKEAQYNLELESSQQKQHELKETMEGERRNCRVMMELVEELADEEQDDMKTDYEVRLRSLEEEIVTLHDQIWELDHQKIRLENQLEAGQAEREKLMQGIEDMQKTIANLEREKNRLHLMISRKEHQMRNTQVCCVDATNRNNEFKRENFIQEHMLQLLREKLHPKDVQIKDMHATIKQLTHDIKKLKNTNLLLDDDLKKANQRIHLFKNSLAKSLQKTLDARTRNDKIASDLVIAAGYTNDPAKLKQTINEIYKRHLDSNPSRHEVTDDSDCAEQMGQQRCIYENTLENLRKEIVLLNRENSRMKNELKQKRVGFQCPPSPVPEP